jgi:hypothetical protein
MANYSPIVTTQPRHSEQPALSLSKGPKGVEESLVGVAFTIASGDSSIPFDYAQGRLLRSLGMTYQRSLSSNPQFLQNANFSKYTMKTLERNS